MYQRWEDLINNYNGSNSYKNIMEQLEEKEKQLDSHLRIFPTRDKILRCFNFFNPQDTKVVILGQDPYHQPYQATGLCFSVPQRIEKLPPSLKNIRKELKADLNITLFDLSLTHWAEQGILLLNSALTVIESTPASQMKLWSDFTDYIIVELNKQENIVFVAWGAFAHNKLKNIDQSKHKLIVSSHPSPLSALKKYGEYPPFINSKPFSKINDYLKEHNKEAIKW